MGEFVIASSLSAEPEVVWRHAVDPAGINREFRPLLRMSFPSGITDLTAVCRPGERLCRSWLLLAGILPVEFDDLVFIEVERGRRFLERSSLWTQRVWEHERIIDALSPGCRVTDRVRFLPRLPWLGAPFALLFEGVFTLRHRNLRALFGDRCPPAASPGGA